MMFYSGMENLALWSRSETVGSAMKDGTNPDLPIFSKPYLRPQEVATQDLRFEEFEEYLQGSLNANLKSWVAA